MTLASLYSHKGACEFGPVEWADSCSDSSLTFSSFTFLAVLLFRPRNDRGPGVFPVNYSNKIMSLPLNNENDIGKISRTVPKSIENHLLMEPQDSSKFFQQQNLSQRRLLLQQQEQQQEQQQQQQQQQEINQDEQLRLNKLYLEQFQMSQQSVQMRLSEQELQQLPQQQKNLPHPPQYLDHVYQHEAHLRWQMLLKQQQEHQQKKQQKQQQQQQQQQEQQVQRLQQLQLQSSPQQNKSQHSTPGPSVKQPQQLQLLQQLQQMQQKQLHIRSAQGNSQQPGPSTFRLEPFLQTNNENVILPSSTNQFPISQQQFNLPTNADRQDTASIRFSQADLSSPRSDTGLKSPECKVKKKSKEKRSSAEARRIRAERNKESARRSRDKRKEEQDSIIKTHIQLVDQNEMLKNNIGELVEKYMQLKQMAQGHPELEQQMNLMLNQFPALREYLNNIQQH